MERTVRDVNSAAMALREKHECMLTRAMQNGAPETPPHLHLLALLLSMCLIGEATLVTQVVCETPNAPLIFVLVLCTYRYVDKSITT